LQKQIGWLVTRVVIDAVVMLLMFGFSGFFWTNAIGTAIWVILLLVFLILPWTELLQKMLKG
jgi:Na+/proline symporter